MTSWKKYVLAAVMVTAALFAYSRNLHKNVPPDFRDAPRDTAIDTLKDINPAGVIGDVKTSDMPEISKGYVAGIDPSAGVPTKPVEWVTINGGKFTMGTDSGEKGFKNAKPIHEVAIKTFDMSKTDVTVEQYTECVIKGKCTEPDTGDTIATGAWRADSFIRSTVWIGLRRVRMPSSKGQGCPASPSGSTRRQAAARIRNIPGVTMSLPVTRL